MLPLAMPREQLNVTGDPRLLIAFSKALEECADNGFSMLDREGLLAIHRALIVVKNEIEQALEQRAGDGHKPN